MSSITNIGQRLYRGEVSYDFVGRWKRWYIFSAIILLVAVASLAFRGLNLGIEFRGGADKGAVWTVRIGIAGVVALLLGSVGVILNERRRTKKRVRDIGRAKLSGGEAAA